MPARISLCLIAKNEEANIGACLDSVDGLVDEMIVVDTGSTDRTAEIAGARRALVHSFAWNDSFADARNAALERATGDWILSLDADERLDSASKEVVRSVVEHPTADAYYLLVRSYLSRGPNPDKADYCLCRLWRNTPERRFRGRVHEDISASITESGGEIGTIDAVIHHHGYTPEAMNERGKHQRNTRILSQELEATPDDLYLLYHMAQEFFAVRDARHAIHFLRRAARLATPDHKFAPDICSHLADCLCDLGKAAIALKVLDRAAELGVTHPQVSFARGKALLYLERAEEAIPAFEAAIEAGNRRAWQGDVETWGYKAHFAIALASQSLHDYAVAAEHCERALELKPGHGETLALLVQVAFRLGTSRAAAGRHADAVQCFARVVEIEPTRAEAYFSAGDALYAMERIPEAADVYLNGLSHAPDHAPGYLALGNCYFRIGALAAAQMAYKQAIARKPDYFEAINNLSLIEEAA